MLITITPIRFDALVGYARAPLLALTSEEVGWFGTADERILGAIIRDRIDGDYGGIIFGRDRKRRFRAVYVLAKFFRSPFDAQRLLFDELERFAAVPDEEFYQDDESEKALDFFTPCTDSTRLHPNFSAVSSGELNSPARGIIEEMMHWYEDADGNFVEQFQTTGFDARIWELYLFAAFRELNYDIRRIHAVPDFTCAGLNGEFCVEAVTVNPTRDKAGNAVPPPPMETMKQKLAFLKHYMPIKFGSALTSKLAKRYWEKANVAGKPLVFAIQDFHATGSMAYTGSALPLYLYGCEWEGSFEDEGNRIQVPQPISEHRWGDKVIPSGFFNLPGSEHVSAVIFSSSGTISKFARMGLLAGFGSERVRMVRHTFAYDSGPHASRPLFAQFDVKPGIYHETWSEGIEVYHNARALHPLPKEWLPGVSHVWQTESGLLESIRPDWCPTGSMTQIWVDETAS
jgi:hypothetical protein